MNADRNPPKKRARLPRRGALRAGPKSKSFLETWKARSAQRREQLRATLAQQPADSSKICARNVWLQRMTKSMATRVEWLEARLEHAKGLQQIIQESAQRIEPHTHAGSSSPSLPEDRRKP